MRPQGRAALHHCAHAFRPLAGVRSSCCLGAQKKQGTKRGGMQAQTKGAVGGGSQRLCDAAAAGLRDLGTECTGPAQCSGGNGSSGRRAGRLRSPLKAKDGLINGSPELLCGRGGSRRVAAGLHRARLPPPEAVCEPILRLGRSWAFSIAASHPSRASHPATRASRWAPGLGKLNAVPAEHFEPCAHRGLPVAVPRQLESRARAPAVPRRSFTWQQHR